MLFLRALILNLTIVFCLPFGQASDKICAEFFAQQSHNKEAQAKIEAIYKESNKFGPNTQRVLIRQLESNPEQAAFLKKIGIYVLEVNGQKTLQMPEDIFPVLEKISQWNNQQVSTEKNPPAGMISPEDNLLPAFIFRSYEGNEGARHIYFGAESPNHLLGRAEPRKDELPLKEFATAMASGIHPVELGGLTHDLIGHVPELSLRPELRKSLRRFYREVAPHLTLKGNTPYDRMMYKRSLYFGEYLSLPDLKKEVEIRSLFKTIFAFTNGKTQRSSLFLAYQMYLGVKISSKRNLLEIESFLNHLESMLIKTGGAMHDGYAIGKSIDLVIEKPEYLNHEILSLQQARRSSYSYLPYSGLTAETILGHMEYARFLISVLEGKHLKSKDYMQGVGAEGLRYLLAYHLSQIQLKVYSALSLKITDTQIMDVSDQVSLPHSPVRQFFEQAHAPGTILYDAFIVEPR